MSEETEREKALTEDLQQNAPRIEQVTTEKLNDAFDKRREANNAHKRNERMRLELRRVSAMSRVTELTNELALVQEELQDATDVLETLNAALDRLD